MKRKYLTSLLMLILPITWTLTSLADAVPFFYTTNSGAITSYIGSGGDVVIPDTIDEMAFYRCTKLTEVVIPDSVTRIGEDAFAYCSGLTSIVVAAANPSYASLDGVLFNKEITTLILFPGGLGSYVVPDSVTSIGDQAFCSCHDLTEVVIPDSVTTIRDRAFSYCSNLQKVYFQGNAPTAPDNVFKGGTGTVYYLEGTTGWRRTYGGWPTAPYEPATLE
jgi:hypothetical protein